MGEFSTTCALSGIPITPRYRSYKQEEPQEVYLIFTLQKDLHYGWQEHLHTFDPCFFWKVIGLPIPGVYNGHGWIEETAGIAVDLTAEYFRKLNVNEDDDHYPSRCLLNLEDVSSWDVLDKITNAVLNDDSVRGQSQDELTLIARFDDFEAHFAKSRNCKTYRIGWLLAHKWAYDKAVELRKKYCPERAENYFWKELIEKIEDTTAENRFRARMRDRGDNVPDVNLSQDDDLFMQLVRSSSQTMFGSGGDLGQSVAGWEYAAAKAYRGDIEVQQQFLDLYRFLQHMRDIGRYVLPPINYIGHSQYLNDWYGTVKEQLQEEVDAEIEYRRENGLEGE